MIDIRNRFPLIFKRVRLVIYGRTTEEILANVYPKDCVAKPRWI